MPTVKFKTEIWPLDTPLVITGHSMSALRTLHVELQDGQHRGRGESAGVYYTGETADSMLAQSESIRSELETGAGWNNPCHAVAMPNWPVIGAQSRFVPTNPVWTYPNSSWRPRATT